jgi:hypothetical protein
MRDVCATPDRFEEEYGRTNLRMSRGYEGEEGDVIPALPG